jgi:hypothetical protein
LQPSANWAKPLQLAVGLDLKTNRGSTLAKILVVDDDPVMQMTVERVLEQSGHAVVAHGSMREPDYPTMATKLGMVHALPKPFKSVALLAMAADPLTSSRPNRNAVSNS